jgi:hypothetical protein
VDCGGGTGDGRRPTGDDGKTRTETGSGEVTALPPLGPVLGRGKTGSTAGWTRPRSTCTSAKKQRMNTEWGNPKVNMNGMAVAAMCQARSASCSGSITPHDDVSPIQPRPVVLCVSRFEFGEDESADYLPGSLLEVGSNEI